MPVGAESVYVNRLCNVVACREVGIVVGGARIARVVEHERIGPGPRRAVIGSRDVDIVRRPLGTVLKRWCQLNRKRTGLRLVAAGYLERNRADRRGNRVGIGGHRNLLACGDGSDARLLLLDHRDRYREVVRLRVAATYCAEARELAEHEARGRAFCGDGLERNGLDRLAGGEFDGVDDAVDGRLTVLALHRRGSARRHLDHGVVFAPDVELYGVGRSSGDGYRGERRLDGSSALVDAAPGNAVLVPCAVLVGAIGKVDSLHIEFGLGEVTVGHAGVTFGAAAEHRLLRRRSECCPLEFQLGGSVACVIPLPQVAVDYEGLEAGDRIGAVDRGAVVVGGKAYGQSNIARLHGVTADDVGIKAGFRRCCRRIEVCIGTYRLDCRAYRAPAYHDADLWRRGRPCGGFAAADGAEVFRIRPVGHGVGDARRPVAVQHAHYEPQLLAAFGGIVGRIAGIRKHVALRTFVLPRPYLVYVAGVGGIADERQHHCDRKQ